MKTLNKLVAVEPIVLDTDKTNAPARGLDLSDRMVIKLVPTKVVFSSETFQAQGTVYFRTDIVAHASARQKFELNGKSFVLIPEDMVIIYNAPDTSTKERLDDGDVLL
jgi:hypothetical protein